MKRILDEDDVFELENDQYIVVDSYEYEENIYYFTNKLLNEDEPSGEFVVFKGVNNGLVLEDRKEVLDKILPYFSALMNKRIDLLKEYGMGDKNE